MSAQQVYTTTLASGHQLVVSTQADFGDIIITCLILALAAILALRFGYGLVYRN